MGIPAAAAACGTKVYRQAVTKNVENCPQLPKKADENSNLRRRRAPSLRGGSKGSGGRMNSLLARGPSSTNETES